MSLYKKSTPKRFPKLVFLAILLGIVQFSWKALSQDTTPDWSTVLGALQAKRDAVTSMKAEYLMQYSVSPETQQRYNRITLEAFKRDQAKGDIAANVPEPVEVYDRVATCRYQSKRDLWREDVGEAYPASPSGKLLNHFHGFDGEKYYAYDADRIYGIIAATINDMLAGTSRYQNASNGNRFVGIEEPVGSLQKAQDIGLTFKTIGNEVVNNEPCVKYQLNVQSQPGTLTRNTVWVNPSKSYSVIRWRSEILKRASEESPWNSRVTVGNALKLEKTAAGIYVNKVYQEDIFESEEDGKLHWIDSRSFILSSIELNPKLPASTFDVQFPPGTRVEDYILSPGQLSVSGADPTFLPKTVSQGAKIKPEPLAGTPSLQPEKGEVFSKPTKP